MLPKTENEINHFDQKANKGITHTGKRTSKEITTYCQKTNKEDTTYWEKTNKENTKILGKDEQGKYENIPKDYPFPLLEVWVWPKSSPRAGFGQKMGKVLARGAGGLGGSFIRITCLICWGCQCQ